MKCSRCKTTRKVGVTDIDDSELQAFKTCVSCRNKLKEYRKTHESKKRKIKEDLKYAEDDNTQIELNSKKRETKNRNRSLERRSVEFNHILQRIYKIAYKSDILIDEICKLDAFTVPYLMLPETPHIEKDNEVSGSLLLKQNERDEKLKSELARSLEIHYLDRILNVLKFSNIEYRFYNSSWKNGRYYLQYRCVEDKLSMKRFGITARIPADCDDRDRGGETETVLKSKLSEWMDLRNENTVNLQLDVDNEPVNFHFQQSIGYYCESRLNLIVDYSKFEMHLKISHKRHKAELKYQDEKKGDDDNWGRGGENTTGKKSKVGRRSEAVDEDMEVGLFDKLESLHRKLV